MKKFWMNKVGEIFKKTRDEKFKEQKAVYGNHLQCMEIYEARMVCR